MPSTRLEIRKLATFAAPPERVFAALTRPEEIVQAYPYGHARIEPWVGGELVFGGGEGDSAFNDFGVVEAFEPGVAFRYRYWSDNHGTPRTPENHLTIEYRMGPAGDGTSLEVLHQGMLPGPYHDAMQGIWDHLLKQLRDFVEAPPQARRRGGLTTV